MNTNIHDNAEDIARKVIGAAIEVHKHLGPGLLESAYASCLAIELGQLGFPYKKQKPLPVLYKGHTIDAAYRLDFLVAGKLINFNVSLLRDGIKRIIL
jgi:GxxExxY protein